MSTPISRSIKSNIRPMILRHMQRMAAMGLYRPMGQTPKIDPKLAPGLLKLRKMNEARRAGGQTGYNINFVFDVTIPRLEKEGVISALGEKRADEMVRAMAAFASKSVKRAQEIKAKGGDHKGFYSRVEKFFTDEIFRFSGWLTRTGDINAVINFLAEIKSEDADVRINAIKRAVEAGMDEAAEDIVRLFRGGSRKERLEIISAMTKLNANKRLAEEMNKVFPAKYEGMQLTDMGDKVPVQLFADFHAASQLKAGPDGNLYLLGTDFRDNSYDKVTRKTFWKYEAATGEWKDISGILPEGFKEIGHSEMVSGKDGKIYIFGGKGGGPHTKDLWTYDPATGEWQDISSGLPENMEPRVSPGMVSAIDGKIYLFGGESNATVRTYKDLWSYDPETGKWQDLSGTVPERLVSRAKHTFIAAADGRLYLMFGAFGSLCTNDAWSYDPVTGTWKDLFGSVPDTLEKRYFARAASGPDGKILVFYGYAPSSRSKQFWQYDPVNDKWEDMENKLPDNLTKKAIYQGYHQMAALPGGDIYLISNYHKKGFDFWKISFPNGETEQEYIERIKKMLEEGAANGSA